MQAALNDTSRRVFFYNFFFNCDQVKDSIEKYVTLITHVENPTVDKWRPCNVYKVHLLLLLLSIDFEIEVHVYPIMHTSDMALWLFVIRYVRNYPTKVLAIPLTLCYYSFSGFKLFLIVVLLRFWLWLFGKLQEGKINAWTLKTQLLSLLSLGAF